MHRVAQDPARTGSPLVVVLLVVVLATLFGAVVHLGRSGGSSPSQAAPSGLTTAVMPVSQDLSGLAPAGAAAAAAAPAPAPAPAKPAPARPAGGSLVLLGDSVPAAAACDCLGFGPALAKTVAATLVNAAQGGLTSEDLLAELDDPARQAQLATAAVVVVTIGANDFDDTLAYDPACAQAQCYAAQLDATANTLQTIAGRLQQLTRPGTRIVFTGYWNVFLDGAVAAVEGPAYTAASDALTRQFNAHLARVAADAGVGYTDLYTPFKGDGSRDDTVLLAADGDHPNVAGHAVIARAVAATALGVPA